MKNYTVFVNIAIAGTITVDAENADNAQYIVEDMDGWDVLSDMVKDGVDVYADDAEENDCEGE